MKRENDSDGEAAQGIDAVIVPEHDGPPWTGDVVLPQTRTLDNWLPRTPTADFPTFSPWRADGRGRAESAHVYLGTSRTWLSW